VEETLMATKDWKKTLNGKERVVFVKNENEIEVFAKWDIYVVRVSKNDHTILIPKEFKTKSQALKFAKAYMKKH